MAHCSNACAIQVDHLASKVHHKESLFSTGYAELVIMTKSRLAPIIDKRGFRSMFILLDYMPFLMLKRCT